ncbi:MAG: hypothetical protein ACFFDK_06625 [Promethearchaeota archaeon]
MVLCQVDTARFIQIYVVQLGMGIIYIIFGLIILRRSTKRLNQLFSTFYLLSASATIINVVYVSLYVNPLVKILHFITYYLFCFAIVYLLIFTLIVLKSERVFTIKKHNLIAVIYGGFLLGLAPIGWYGGITIDASTNWRPVWSLAFLVYALIVISGCIIPTLYYSIQVYKKFEDEIIKRKWLFYILAILGYFTILYISSISNYLNDPTFRLMTSISGLSLYATAFLLYYGVGRQIEK